VEVGKVGKAGVEDKNETFSCLDPFPPQFLEVQVTKKNSFWKFK